MPRDLPPLNSLRVFEVLARHMSAAKAATELGVTVAAISHQIKTIETDLGTPLFQRVKGVLSLTDAGQAILPGVRAGFAQFAAAIERLGQIGEGGILTVTVAPSFADKWLLPRLDGFQALHPEIDVRVAASMALADFRNDGIDVAIRYGGGAYPDLHVERLFGEAVFPVCSPALLKGDNPLGSLAALAKQTLLHDDSPGEDPTCPNWAMWLKAAGIEGADATRGPRFNQSSLVLEAAALGRGVALAKGHLAAADLELGRLVKPFEGSVPMGFGYFIVCPPLKLELQKVKLFLAWLRAQAA
jgi:LysR family glycine cleavage system transcriptional activator